MDYITCKTLVQKTTQGKYWFGIDYNMNLYKGCNHGCIYCDSRSNCYRIDDFDRVRGKENCIEILNRELTKKRKKGVIGTGAMSDSYNPLEGKYEITRKALQCILNNKFGVSLATKSDLITRDIDLYQKISKEASVILKITITASDDKLSKLIEPNASVSSKRFEALKKLTDSGLFAGVLFTPIIPFITDTEENTRDIIRKAHEAGAKFIYSIGGVTLRENQRDYFYKCLDKSFPGIKEKYIKTYENKYFCNIRDKNIARVFKQECEKYNILYKMEDIIKAYKKENDIKLDIEEAGEQINLFEI